MSDILARLTTLTQKPKCHRSASRNRRRMPFASVVAVFSSSSCPGGECSPLRSAVHSPPTRGGTLPAWTILHHIRNSGNAWTVSITIEGGLIGQPRRRPLHS